MAGRCDAGLEQVCVEHVDGVPNFSWDNSEGQNALSTLVQRWTILIKRVSECLMTTAVSSSFHSWMRKPTREPAANPFPQRDTSSEGLEPGISPVRVL
jgi:hypothetical protein